MDTRQAEIEGIDLAPKRLPLEKFDRMIDFITEEQGIGYWGSIIQGIKLLLICSFLIARASLVQAAIEENKRRLQQLIRQRNQNANEIND